MSTLFSEKEADQEVISNLLHEITNLRRYQMPIVKTVEGKFYRVEADQEVSAEAVQTEVNELTAKVTELEAILAPAPAADPAPTEPAPTPPTDSPAPEQPAPAGDPTPPVDDAPAPILQ